MPDDPCSPEFRPSEEQTASSSPPDREHERIGPYTILERRGEGGMGIVFLAEQTEPVRRRVALKVIKHGMDTKQVIARFEAERQALALMDHPAIAKIYDAGTTPEGRPYFAMEYIQGVPITEHCDRHKLTNPERLDLFLQVCEGVQHAHQKAVIHRDLKPSNVLVAIQDGRAVPKIIDFGVAKAIAQRLTETTIYTELGVLIGTPEYMSPEQAEMTGQNVDTRTDVYSLGVLLYELLVGALPFELKELRQAGLDEMRRKIREDDPPRPSTRASGLGAASMTSARNRGTDPSRLASQLRGDLDWIAMKALEKNRTRRYGSPSEIAADIKRHLTDQPVIASPPSAAYRVRKFVRRHTVGVAIATGAVLVLVAFVGTMVWQAGRIALQRDRAERQTRTANHALEFLTKLFEVSDAREYRGNTITQQEILNRAAKRLESEFGDEPAVRARLMLAVGKVYLSFGMHEPAAPLIERSLRVRRECLGKDHPDTLQSAETMGRLLTSEGKLKEAEPYLREVLGVRRRVLGNDHPDTLKAIAAMGSLFVSEGKPREAEPYLREVLETRRRVLGSDHPDTILSISAMGDLLGIQNKNKEAKQYILEATEGFQRLLLGSLKSDHPDTRALMSIMSLGAELKAAGSLKTADPYYREALECSRRLFGNDHPVTLTAINNMGTLLQAQGKLKEAEIYYREALKGRRRAWGNNGTDTLRSIYNMVDLLKTEGRLKEAEPYYREWLEGCRRRFGSDSSNHDKGAKDALGRP